MPMAVSELLVQLELAIIFNKDSDSFLNYELTDSVVEDVGISM